MAKQVSEPARLRVKSFYDAINDKVIKHTTWNGQIKAS